MKISIPDDLRRQIIDCQAALSAQTEDANARRARLVAELSRLEADAEKLAAEISKLEPAAVRSSAVAQKLAARESRIDLVKNRIKEVRSELENFELPGLGLAVPVLREIIRFYIDALPGAFADHVLPFYGTHQEAIRLIHLCPARQVLNRLASLCYNLEHSPAVGGNAELVGNIFRRALNGQPHLGVDPSDAAAGPDSANP